MSERGAIRIARGAGFEVRYRGAAAAARTSLPAIAAHQAYPMTSNDTPPPRLNPGEKRILKVWAVLLTLAALGQVLRWLGVF